jgi:hypothetical protein
MPWCGYFGAGYWWVLPLIGLVFMGVMFFLCSRGSGCMGIRRRASSAADAGDAVADLRSSCCGPRERTETKSP